MAAVGVGDDGQWVLALLPATLTRAGSRFGLRLLDGRFEFLDLRLCRCNGLARLGGVAVSGGDVDGRLVLSTRVSRCLVRGCLLGL